MGQGDHRGRLANQGTFPKHLFCTSVMLPRWDLGQTFDKLAEYGYEGIELRCRYNPSDPNAELS